MSADPPLTYTAWLDEIQRVLSVEYAELRWTDISADTLEHWYRSGYSPEDALHEGLGEHAVTKRKLRSETLGESLTLMRAVQDLLSILSFRHPDVVDLKTAAMYFGEAELRLVELAQGIESTKDQEDMSLGRTAGKSGDGSAPRGATE